MRTRLALTAGFLVVLAACSRSDDASETAAKTSGADDTPATTGSAAMSVDSAAAPSGELSADAAAIARGRGIASENCLRCHAAAPGEASKHPSAPSFATLFGNYPADYIAEAFAEGVFVGHGDMPAFEFSADQINDLVAFLKTLEPTQG